MVDLSPGTLPGETFLLNPVPGLLEVAPELFSLTPPGFDLLPETAQFILLALDLLQHFIEPGGEPGALYHRSLVGIEGYADPEIPDAIRVGLVAPGLAGLGLDAPDPLAHLIDKILQPVEIILHPQQRPQALGLTNPVLGDSGCLFEDHPPVGITGLQKDIDLALLQDGIGGGSKTRIEEEGLDVLEATGLLVDEVFTFTTSEQAPGDRDLCEVDVEIPVGIVKHDRDLSISKRLAVLCTTEDDILHLRAPEPLGRLAAKDPLECIDYIRFPAAIGPDDSRNAGLEIQARTVRERFKTYQLKLLQMHLETPLFTSRQGKPPTLAGNSRNRLSLLQFLNRPPAHSSLITVAACDEKISWAPARNPQYCSWLIEAELKPVPTTPARGTTVVK